MRTALTVIKITNCPKIKSKGKEVANAITTETKPLSISEDVATTETETLCKVTPETRTIVVEDKQTPVTLNFNSADMV